MGPFNSNTSAQQDQLRRGQDMIRKYTSANRKRGRSLKEMLDKLVGVEIHHRGEVGQHTTSTLVSREESQAHAANRYQAV